RVRRAGTEPARGGLALQRTCRRLAALADAGRAVRVGEPGTDDAPRAGRDRLPAALTNDDGSPDSFLPAAVQYLARDRLQDDPVERSRWSQGARRRPGDHPAIAIDRQGIQVLHAGRRVRPRRRHPAASDLSALPAGRQPGTDPDHGRAAAEAGWGAERARRPRRSGSFTSRRRRLPNLTQLPIANYRVQAMRRRSVASPARMTRTQKPNTTPTSSFSEDQVKSAPLIMMFRNPSTA